MRDVVRDAEVLAQLRVQRGRLADRMRAPRWYLPGIAIGWALVFTFPLCSRFLPQAVSTWPLLVVTLVVFCLLQWGLARATGVAVGTRTLLDRPGRPARIAMIVVGVAAIGTETFLIRHGPLVAAIAVAALAVVAEVACWQANLRGIRKDLRAGGGAA